MGYSHTAITLDLKDLVSQRVLTECSEPLPPFIHECDLYATKGYAFLNKLMQREVRRQASTAVVGVSDGADMTPVIDIRVERQDFARWGGFIASIGEDSIL